MAGRKRTDNIISRDSASFMLFLCALCIVSLVLSLSQGTGSMFYAGSPMWLSAAYLNMCIAGCTSEMRRQIQNRIKKRHFNDAMQLYRASQLGALTTGVIMTLLYTLAAQILASHILGIRDAYLVLYAMAPAVFLGSFIGNMRGILEAVGSHHISRVSMLLLSILSIVLSIVCSIRMAVRGEKVGALLMNTGYKAVYIAAGAGMGISAAVAVTFIFLLIMSHFAVKYIRDREDYLAIDNEEQFRDLYVYYFTKVGPYALVSLLPVLLVIVNYRFYTGALDGATAADYHSEWGGFMGITVPFVLLLIIGCSALYTREIERMTAEFIKESYKRLRLRFSMVMRLSGYVLIPATFFTFGAAKPFVEIFHGGLYGGATDGAVLSLKYMSPLLFLGATMVIIAIFYWASYYQSLVIVSLLFGAAFEIGAMSILTGAGFGMNAVPLALDVFAAAYLCCAYYLGKRQILARCDSSWIIDDLLIGISAAIAAVPVILLNDIMTTQMIPLIGVVILFAIFAALYIVIAILLGCTDYGNLARYPGGRFIVQIAVMLGRTSE